MASLKRKQRKRTKKALRDVQLPLPPLVVTITRVGPRTLDDDNLQGACKHVRDEIADKVGLDDGSPLYTWLYRQEMGDYGVIIDIRQR